MDVGVTDCASDVLLWACEAPMGTTGQPVRRHLGALLKVTSWRCCLMLSFHGSHLWEHGLDNAGCWAAGVEK